MGRRPNKVTATEPTVTKRYSKPTKDEAAIITLIAMGISGWSLVIELLIALEKKGVLTDKRCRKFIQAAAIGLKAMDDLSPHPAIQVAHALLQGQIDGWVGVTGKED